MTDEFILEFISQEDFEKHVSNTLMEYNDVLKPIDLKAFNSNIIDPIKLLFDKNVFSKSFEEIISLELQRQRDKTNNNSIGYFHQKIFQYIKNCKVPKQGWDITFEDTDCKYYIELKNKHNTMNSSSSAKTYMRMQNHLLNALDKDKSICALVEVIAKKSQNIPWIITIDKTKQSKNEKLRRISIDKFYEIITGDKNSFNKLCKQLPTTIEKLVLNNKNLVVGKDTVYEELQKINEDILLSLYKLAFKTYEGF
jgi:eco47II restriction endonuclease